MVIPGLPYANSAIKCQGGCLAKWVNCAIATQKTVRVCFVSQRLSDDRRVYSWRIKRLFVLPVFTVETSGWLNSETSTLGVNLFQLLSSTVGRLEELIVETFRVKPSEWLQLVLFRLFIGGYFGYTDEFNKCGIGEVQWLFRPNAWYKQIYLPEETQTTDNVTGTRCWSEFFNIFPGNLQLCFVFHYI